MAKQIDQALAKTTEEQQFELQTASATAAVQQEIQASIAIALRFPRNEDSVYSRLIKTSKRPAFAEIAQYQFPRGNTTVRGPSVNMAREAGRCWGNCRWGLEVVRDEEDTRLIRGWAWDLQTNTKISSEDSFRKLIQRKSGGQTKWIKPDERDLRELTNRMGAILVRNCLLQVIPRDFVDDALAECHRTLQDEAAGDPESAKKRVLGAFASINVSVESLEQFLGHKIAECSPKEIADLRTIYASIRDGNSRWSEYEDSTGKDTGGKPPASVGRVSVDDSKAINEEAQRQRAEPQTVVKPESQPSGAAPAQAEQPPDPPAQTPQATEPDRPGQETLYYRRKVQEEIAMIPEMERVDALQKASIRQDEHGEQAWLEPLEVIGCMDTQWLYETSEYLKQQRQARPATG